MAGRIHFIYVVRYVNERGQIEYDRNSMGTVLNYASLKAARQAVEGWRKEGVNRRDMQALRTTRDRL